MSFRQTELLSSTLCSTSMVSVPREFWRDNCRCQALLSDWLVRLGNFSGTISKACPRHRASKLPSVPRERKLKTQQSPVILDLYLRKLRSGKSRDYRNVIVFYFFKLFSVHTTRCKAAECSNSSGLNSVCEKLGLVCTVGLAVEIRLRFKISSEKCSGRALRQRWLKKEIAN